MSYTTITKPSAPIVADVTKAEMKNYLLDQEGDFLLFQDGSQINIGGTNYEEVEKPTAPVYSTVTKP